MVIVISGPIASGKSTVARTLAREVERHGRTAAAVDLDLVYEMLEHGGARKDDAVKWMLARHAAAALVDALVSDGVDVVIVDGDFLSADDRRDFVRALRSETVPAFATLRVSFDTALRRVHGDASRTHSRDHRFLREHYDLAEQAVHDLPPGELLLDTESVTPEDVARAIAEAAMSGV